MNESRFLLQALNAETGWLDLRALTEPLSYTVTGNFPGGTVISIRYSNNDLVAKGTEYTTDDVTITKAGTYELPAAIARFVDFVMTGFAGGASVVIALAKGRGNKNITLIDVVPQSATFGNSA